MSDASSAPTVTGMEDLWKEALRVYEGLVGHKFHEDPLADRLSSCATAEEIYFVLEETQGEFKAFRAKGKKIRDFLKPLVYVVESFIDVGGETANFLGFPGSKAPFVAFGALLAAAKGVSAAYDGLETLMARLVPFLNRVKVHLDVPATYHDRDPGGLTKILVEILANLLHAFALATKYLKRKISKHRLIRWVRARFPIRMRHFAKHLMGNQDVADSLKRLDELMWDELAMATAEARRAEIRTESLLEEMQRSQINHLHIHLCDQSQSKQPAVQTFDVKLEGWKDSCEDWIYRTQARLRPASAQALQALYRRVGGLWEPIERGSGLLHVSQWRDVGGAWRSQHVAPVA
ncbi:hypothetical protein K488DRAFT_70607 [Vararia minispora EC-137]|uniref:Uncharacterized protein n=1 Tax=Vararia minispora EC-137 TaxID=1314806 RepID=A0ACB8QKU6_9AGAM|nr:hypothetical protein K488DRAFT_70607 [Vararia minispora EC-137]